MSGMSARELLLNAKAYMRRHLAGRLVVNYADIYALAVHIIDHIPLHVEQSANVPLIQASALVSLPMEAMIQGTRVVHIIDAVLQHEGQLGSLQEWVKTDFYIEILKAYETYYKKMAEKSSCWVRFLDLFCCRRRETVLRPVFSVVSVKAQGVSQHESAALQHVSAALQHEPAALQHEPAALQHEFVNVDFLGKDDNVAYPRGIPIV